METVDALASRSLGLVSRPRLLQVGYSDDVIQRHLRTGTLQPVHPGVFRGHGVVMSPRRELLAACLAAGPEAVASHRAALWIWRLLDGPPPVEITVPYDRGPVVTGAIVHRLRDLRGEHCLMRRGVPVTNPSRALVDAGAVLSRAELGRCVELALVQKMVSVAGLRAVLARLSRRGRNGVGVLRAYLDQRALADHRPESVLEPVMARLLLDHSVGAIEFQAILRLDGRTVRVDFLLPRPRIVVEVDGLSVHGSRDALDHDLERQNLLVRHGYLVLRYTVTHLRRPAQTAREIIATARQRIEELEPVL